jgi:uncharacterized membrane protein YhhN
MPQDLAHKRPFLLASLIFGISYPLANYLAVPEIFSIIWKMAAVGFLVPYALRKHHDGDFVILGGFLALYALGDGLIEIEMLWGGIAFAIGHIFAIWLYLRHWRKRAAFSQRVLALTVLICAPFIAYTLPGTEYEGQGAAPYTFVIASMAACAWSSQFPRYRVGIGAMIFVVSDLLIFARLGPLAGAGWVGLAIWYLYYVGVLMITTGVVTTLVKRGHFSED